MNAEGMPYWLRRAFARLTHWYATHYKLVLCSEHGEQIVVSQPRHLVISGPGVSLGNHCRIDPSPDAQIHLSTWPYFEPDASSAGPQISLGDYCTLSPGVRLIAAQRIVAGHSCMFASNVYVTDADWHGLNHRVFPPGESAPVLLGDNVWLGEQVIVLKGVSIGNNTIVGAGAVVTSSLPANAIAAGNPARVVAAIDEEASSTTRRELFEELDFIRFEQAFWSQRLQGNRFWRWALGVVWPAAREHKNL